MKKYVMVWDNDRFRICRVLGIYYGVNSNFDGRLIEKIKLFTLCFSVKTKKFMYIDKVDLPERIYNRYQNSELTSDVKLELEKIGIFNYNNIKLLIDLYNERMEQFEINKYILNNNIEENIAIHEELLKIQDSLISFTNDVKSLVKKL